MWLKRKREAMGKYASVDGECTAHLCSCCRLHRYITTSKNIYKKEKGVSEFPFWYMKQQKHGTLFLCKKFNIFCQNNISLTCGGTTTAKNPKQKPMGEKREMCQN